MARTRDTRNVDTRKSIILHMHGQVNLFIEEVKKKYPHFFKEKKVLEVGSLDINGSIRPYFENCDYTGLDLGEGKGVDIVGPIHEHHIGTLDTGQIIYWAYDVIVSTEMLEHDVHWKESLVSMYNNLKPGGLLILTCAGPNRHEHGTKRTTPQDSPFTTDYYRNISMKDFMEVLPLPKNFADFKLNLVRGDTDLQFYGIKHPQYD